MNKPAGNEPALKTITKLNSRVAAKSMNFQHDILTLFMMGLFGPPDGMRGRGGGAKRPSLSKICSTYPTLMKLGTVIPYLKMMQKIHKSCDTHFDFCGHQHFLTGNQQFLSYQGYRLHFNAFLTFFEF